MLRYVSLLAGAFLIFLTSGCSTANSRYMNQRLAELETRVHRLEAGPEYASKSIPQYSEDIETIGPVDIASLPERKMPKTR